MRTKIIEENAEYLKHAKNIWVAANKRLSEIKSSVRQYAENRWRDSLSRCMSYAELYEEIKKLPLSYAEDDIPIEVINTSNLLEVVSRKFIYSDCSYCCVCCNKILSVSITIKYYIRLLHCCPVRIQYRR